jgi:hypothetical protein
MKAERIGTTPSDQLKWIIGLVDRRLPRSEGDWLNLRDEICLLVGIGLPIPPGAPYKKLEQFLTDLIEAYRSIIDRAVAHEQIGGLPRPSPVLVWDGERYRKQPSFHDVTFLNLAIGHLAQLVETHGHLLKRCEAPAKMRPGRKPKDKSKDEAVGFCGNLFVARKKTQLYCSSACLNRVLTRKKRAKLGKKKRKPK